MAPGACGPLGCMQFDDVGQALAVVLARKPLVIGFGEAHAQRGKEGIPSSAKHFTDELLPVLAPRSSDLVLELMTPAKRPDGTGCAETAAAVKDKQKVVTAPQAASNQSEYVTMGEAARKLGVVPDLLRPTCEDLAAIDKAGDDMVVLTLETTARLTQAKVSALLDRNAKSESDKEKIVLGYGGGMHNDMRPPKERAAWSYGPELAKRAGGRYVEIDLYVSDFVEPTDIWKKMPWYPHYDRDRLGDRITMYEPTPGSFVILLPRRKPG